MQHYTAEVCEEEAAQERATERPNSPQTQTGQAQSNAWAELLEAYQGQTRRHTPPPQFTSPGILLTTGVQFSGTLKAAGNYRPSVNTKTSPSTIAAIHLGALKSVG